MLTRRILGLKGFILVTLVSYSWSAPLPPSFLAGLNHQDKVVPLYWFKPGLLPAEMYYDAGEIVLAGYVEPEWNENAFAVKFTVLDTPFVLLGSKVYIAKADSFPDLPGDQHSPFEITVHLDSNGIPGRLISGPILTSADSNHWDTSGQWVEVIHNNLITKTTDFWIVFHWLEDTPTAPLVCENNNPDSMRSYLGKREEEVFKWYLWDFYDYMIRAEVLSNNLDSDSLNPLPDSFKIYRFTAANRISSSDNLIKTLPGNQFQYSDSNVSNGTNYFYSVTAFESGQESPPSDTIATLPLEKAQIFLSGNHLEVVLNSVLETTLSITLSNIGQVPLYYNINTILRDDLGNIISDGFGYTWKASDSQPEVNFEWVDIEDQGNIIAEDIGDNENWGPYALGFSFPFYGNSFDSIRVTANGWLSFTSQSQEFKNKSLPDNDGNFNLIAPFWDDLILDTSSKIIYFANNADSAIITFSKIKGYPQGGPYTFQAILTKSGQIIFQYKIIQNDSSSATIGIQNQDGSIGLEVAYNQDFVQDSSVIKVNPSWMEIFPRRGVVNGGVNETLNLKLRRNFLTKGMYQGDLVFKNWDENQSFPNLSIPVTLLVDSVTSVREIQTSAALTFNLSQNYPNPFNQNTVIQYTLPKPSKVELVIYNLLGQRIRRLINEIQAAGYKTVFWDGKNEKGEDIASGIYFYQLKLGDFTQTKKMLLLK